MSTATLEHVEATVGAPAESLTTQEEDSLLVLAASVEKVARVRAGSSTLQSRAWSFGGNVD